MIKESLMVNPQYIEYLNAFGADIDASPQPLKPAEPPKRGGKQIQG